MQGSDPRGTAASLARRLVKRLRGAVDRPGDEVLSLEEVRLRLLRRGHEPKVILEVGANDGTDTIRFLDSFPEAEIHCFEPDPRAIAAFKQNVRSPRVHLYQVALGSDDTRMRFYQSSGAPPGREEEFPEGWHLSGSLRPPKAHLDEHPWCRFETSIEVSVQRLDTWATQAGISSVDFMWADVQGAEIDLIRGGRETLKSTALFYTEVSDTELYEGQAAFSVVQEALTHHRVAKRFRHDALFERI